MDRQTDRQTDRPTDRPTDRQTDRWIDICRSGRRFVIVDARAVPIIPWFAPVRGGATRSESAEGASRVGAGRRHSVRVGVTRSGPASLIRVGGEYRTWGRAGVTRSESASLGPGRRHPIRVGGWSIARAGVRCGARVCVRASRCVRVSGRAWLRACASACACACPRASPVRACA